ncbi:hypothetical protein Pres01_07370 [Metapseudomonas resinovorans]|nr:hypothetical protein Pres01_07370 [Pseudomonas resinovorans]
MANQPGEVMGNEPGLVVDHQGAQAEGMAVENERGVCVVHGGSPVSELRTATVAVNRRVADREGLTDRLQDPADPRVSPRDLP